MTKEVAKTTGTEVAAPVSTGRFSSKVDASDIMIPKILLMQAISALVSDEKAKAGDMVHSLDEIVIGSKETKPIEFVVLDMYKTMITFENGDYIKTEPLTAENKDLPWEETVGNTLVKRQTCQNYYVIKTDDVENMTVFPHVITFKSTSFRAAKKLATKLVMIEEFGAECYEKTFKLVAKQEENDKGKFYVFDVLDGRRSTDAEKQQAAKWIERLGKSTVKVHEAEEDDATSKQAPNADVGF